MSFEDMIKDFGHGNRVVIQMCRVANDINLSDHCAAELEDPVDTPWKVLLHWSKYIKEDFNSKNGEKESELNNALKEHDAALLDALKTHFGLVKTHFDKVDNHFKTWNPEPIKELLEKIRQVDEKIQQGDHFKTWNPEPIKDLFEKIVADQKAMLNLALDNNQKLDFIKTPPRATKRQRIDELDQVEQFVPTVSQLSQNTPTPSQASNASTASVPAATLKQPPAAASQPAQPSRQSAVPPTPAAQHLPHLPPARSNPQPPHPYPQPAVPATRIQPDCVVSVNQIQPDRVVSVVNAFDTLMQNAKTTSNAGTSNKGIMLSEFLMEMRPIKWGDGIEKNSFPLYVGRENHGKCLNAFYLLEQVATEEHKSILGSRDSSNEHAKKAAKDATQLCMQRLLELESRLSGKEPREDSRSKPTVIAIGGRYRKFRTKNDEMQAAIRKAAKAAKRSRKDDG
jgi:hypothetical protein